MCMCVYIYIYEIRTKYAHIPNASVGGGVSRTTLTHNPTHIHTIIHQKIITKQVSDKLEGRVLPSRIASLTLDDIRRGGAESVKSKMLRLLDREGDDGTTLCAFHMFLVLYVCMSCCTYILKTHSCTPPKIDHSRHIHSHTTDATAYVVVNAVTRADLETAVHGCLLAEEAAAAEGGGKGSFVCVIFFCWLVIH